MTFDEVFEIINEMIDGLDREVNMLSETDHALYPIGQIVGLLKAKAWIRELQVEYQED